MIEKIATENELFTLGGGGEIDKPSNYDMNRCVTKARSKQFKTINPNLTAYQDLQLIPVSLFGKVVMADTVQFLFEHSKESQYNTLQFDIVLSVDDKEYHYYDSFPTYDWVYNSSFVTQEVVTEAASKKEFQMYSVDLKKVKEIIGNNNNARIQLKAKWYNVRHGNTTVNYTVKLLANGEEKYSNLNSINLLTFEYFPIDVFFRKIFEVAYNRSNDTITVLDNSEPDRTAKFEYDILIKKNSNVLVDKHLITKSDEFNLLLYTKDFNRGDVATYEIKNFKIHLSTSNGTEKLIIPKFTETNIGSKIKNGCKLSILKNDIDHYVMQIEILEELPITAYNGNNFLFTIADLKAFDFKNIYFPFSISLSTEINSDSYYSYYNIDHIIQSFHLFN